MKLIGEFLSKFKNLGLNERMSKKAVAEAINEAFKTSTVSEANVVIRNGVAMVRCCSSLKSEIKLRKEKLLGVAKEKVGLGFVVTDIR